MSSAGGRCRRASRASSLAPADPGQVPSVPLKRSKTRSSGCARSSSISGFDAGAHTIADPPRASPRRGAGAIGRHDLADLSGRGFVTPQPQKRPTELVDAVRADHAERTLAGRHHPLAPRRRCRGRDLERDRRPLPAVGGLGCPDRSSRPPTSWRASTEALRPMGSAPRCSPTTGRCSPRHPVAVGARSSSSAHARIRVVHSRPYHPQTCGKVERFHQTLKRFLAKQDPADTIVELQSQLDRFADYYNTVRPHRAIGRRTPAEAFAARPKATPSAARLPVPGHFRLRRDKVDITGS